MAMIDPGFYVLARQMDLEREARQHALVRQVKRPGPLRRWLHRRRSSEISVARPTRLRRALRPSRANR